MSGKNNGHVFWGVFFYILSNIITQKSCDIDINTFLMGSRGEKKKSFRSRFSWHWRTHLSLKARLILTQTINSFQVGLFFLIHFLITHTVTIVDLVKGNWCRLKSYKPPLCLSLRTQPPLCCFHDSPGTCALFLQTQEHTHTQVTLHMKTCHRMN